MKNDDKVEVFYTHISSNPLYILFGLRKETITKYSVLYNSDTKTFSNRKVLLRKYLYYKTTFSYSYFCSYDFYKKGSVRLTGSSVLTTSTRVDKKDTLTDLKDYLLTKEKDKKLEVQFNFLSPVGRRFEEYQVKEEAFNGRIKLFLTYVAFMIALIFTLYNLFLVIGG